MPGVGKKTAQRLLIDLKSRLVDPRPRRVPAPGATAPAPTDPPAPGPTSATPLAGLGYTDGEVREVMADLPDDGDAGALLRDALQRLGAARR